MIWNLYLLETTNNIDEAHIWEKIGVFCYSIMLEDKTENNEKSFEIVCYAEKELLEFIKTLNDYTLLKYERPTNDEILDYANENGGLSDLDKLLIESNLIVDELRNKVN
jgi:hypothetical protein